MPDGGLTPGDPLGGGNPRPPREHERERPPLWQEEAPATVVPGYSSPPPPGAGGSRPASTAYRGGGELILAGWWRRVGATLIDGLIVGAVALAIMAPLGIGVFASGDNETGVIAFALAFAAAAIVVTVVAFIYAPLLMAKTNGQTLGRMATGIRVVRTNGEPMSFGWAMLREVAVKNLLINVVGGSITFGLASLLDVLWPLWDEENRALHDFLVQTRTVMS